MNPRSQRNGASVNVLRRIDSDGTVVNEYRYSAFGKPELVQEGVPNSPRFMARVRDADAGLHYVRNGWYDPEVGRFVSEDRHAGRGHNLRFGRRQIQGGTNMVGLGLQGMASSMGLDGTFTGLQTAIMSSEAHGWDWLPFISTARAGGRGYAACSAAIRETW